jgi:hypothetical protein
MKYLLLLVVLVTMTMLIGCGGGGSNNSLTAANSGTFESVQVATVANSPIAVVQAGGSAQATLGDLKIVADGVTEGQMVTFAFSCDNPAAAAGYFPELSGQSSEITYRFAYTGIWTVKVTALGETKTITINVI